MNSLLIDLISFCDKLKSSFVKLFVFKILGKKGLENCCVSFFFSTIKKNANGWCFLDSFIYFFLLFLI